MTFMTEPDWPKDGYIEEVLDQGFVMLLDLMGDDLTPVNVARVSYDKAADEESTPDKMTEKDLNLLNYLYREEHMGPFEQIQLQFKIKAPLFVVKQFLRHRTAKVNEVSMRYVKPKLNFYHPDSWRGQAKSNKQASVRMDLTKEVSRDLYDRLEDHCENACDLYHLMIEKGVCREQARMVLPQNLYTSFVWSMDMRNLIHFLKLREAEGAQWEIREYAEAIKKIIKVWYPRIHEIAWP